jgi:hypothetical protein
MPASSKRTNPIVLKPGLSIGANAAEMDDEFLLPCFVTYPAVDQCQAVNSRGTVVHGRTGSGKTAILRYIASKAEHVTEIDPFDMSMSYVSNSDVLKFLYAIGADLDLLFQVLWKHVLCIEYIRLRFSVSNEAASRNAFQWLTEKFTRDERKKKAIAYLRAWEGRFWITMDQNIKELTERVEDAVKLELGAEIEKFKAGGQYDKRLSVDRKTEMVHRVRKIISEEQLTELGNVIDLLSQVEHGHHVANYYILIDKLDESWVDAALRFKMIRGLIESLKAFRRIQNLKVLVALRTDVLERVVQETKDLTFQREKLDDYFVHIKWTKSLLRSVIENRIQSLFRKQYSGGTISFDDVFTTNRVSGSLPFDYMIERTLLRPRDIISFVNECLAAARGRYDVTAAIIKQAETEFSTKRRHSIEQEWQSAYPQIKRLLDLLGSKRKALLTSAELGTLEELSDLSLSICTASRVGYDPLYPVAEEYCMDSSSKAFIKTIVSILYRVGAIGVKLEASARHQYSYLDRPLLAISEIPDHDVPLRVHPMLHATFRIASATERP